MASPMFHAFTKQASFFLKEKIKTARLAITDVTVEELLTEEVTSNNHLPPDARTMAILSRAAFDLDLFERIIKVLHNRFLKFERKNWRAFYNALVLLEHLLIHGPLSVAKEFESDKEAIEETRKFQYVDEKGINWGMKVTNLLERILRLLEDKSRLKEERERWRKLTCGRIVGFGDQPSFRSFSADGGVELSRDYGRCNSLFNDHPSYGNDHSFVFTNPSEKDGHVTEEDHPFIENEHEATASFLSTA